MPGTDRKIMPEKLQDEEGNDSNKRGLLAPLGDPVGSVTGSILAPLGSGVGALTGSVAEGAATVTSGLQEKAGIPDRGVEKEKAEEAKKRMGGKEQSSENPLGL
ncbi:hypothetical protein MBLNU457_6802t1 [Dothideomycetes sp. NU457]